MQKGSRDYQDYEQEEQEETEEGNLAVGVIVGGGLAAAAAVLTSSSLSPPLGILVVAIVPLHWGQNRVFPSPKP